MLTVVDRQRNSPRVSTSGNFQCQGLLLLDIEREGREEAEEAGGERRKERKEEKREMRKAAKKETKITTMTTTPAGPCRALSSERQHPVKKQDGFLPSPFEVCPKPTDACLPAALDKVTTGINEMEL